MAGLVIISNDTNEIRQTGETESSWLLRALKYETHHAINTARWENTNDPKWLAEQALNAVNVARQAGETIASWAARTGLYKKMLRPEYTAVSPMSTLKKSYEGSDYSHMRFLQGNIPVNNLILKNKNGEFIEFVDAKINIRRENTIVETALAKREGTIKEYIAAKDYAIDISGNIMISENYYPTFEIGKVNRFLKEPEVFDVVNTYLEAFDIAKVVFRSGDFNQQSQKYFNVLPFRFQFISDNDEENAYGLIIEN
ncbi:MAG: DUF6046 domain-containing protein [Bacteroidetes bacterium]|nr:DUF6046 domain-containing protein [Bacteroidota bacterium]MCL2302908.1 DUF6046 domain-containing protein [Lentimicrobiaceae bacterium]